ncbi:MAG: dihydropteroate [Geobacteraceae bacterium]|nr:MAG: dihydropteroate [Geobacteraceae bacterium]
MACSVRRLVINSLADAERELAAINADPFSIRNLGPKMLHRLLLVEGVGCEEGNILKQEILAMGGDAAVTRGAPECGILRSDVIIMGTEKQLRRLCSTLLHHPLGFSILAAEIIKLLDTEANPPKTWQIGRRTLDFSRQGCVMGILNVTPDSFSDGNRFSDVDRAVERALEMEAEGADIIDIGGESTRPFAPPVDEREELTRVMPVLERLAGLLKIPVSIDTYKSAVAREALAAGAEIVNDISALTFDERMAGVVAGAGAGLVLMHTRGKPSDMQKDTAYGSIIAEITASLNKLLAMAESAGIAAERIVVDPGIGFGKSAEGNLEIVRRLAEFSVLGRPIMVGISRKSFIGKVLGREVGERAFGTAAAVAVALANGASIFRVHDVKEMRDVVDMATALLSPAAESV